MNFKVWHIIVLLLLCVIISVATSFFLLKKMYSTDNQPFRNNTQTDQAQDKPPESYPNNEKIDMPKVTDKSNLPSPQLPKIPDRSLQRNKHNDAVNFKIEVVGPCKQDVKKFCEGENGGTKSLRCMLGVFDRLSKSCAVEIEKSYKEEFKYCLKDVDKFCKGVRPGEGRLLKCLEGNIDSLSRSCLNYIQNNF